MIRPLAHVRGSSPRFAVLAAVLAFSFAFAAPGRAGSIFVTAHDPDFHADVGANAPGAEHINQVAIGYIMDAAFNPYVSGGINKFLFVESSITPPPGHVDGLGGLVNSGYVSGVNFERHTALDLNSELNLLGTKYSGIVVASDFGGILTQAELNILNARSADILTFLNSGGGLYAMSESDLGAGLTPDGGQYGFLPFLVSSAALNEGEVGNTLTPFGLGLGLLNTDINGNASHAYFTATGGMNVVDVDPNAHILSLATRSAVTSGGVVPEPKTLALLGLGLLGLVALRARKG